MGKSRSATIVIAYLMHKYNLWPDVALAQLREGRGVCDPNEGFWEQLKLYHTMGTPTNVEGNATYQRWLYQKELAASRNIRQAPEADKIRFEDEHAGTVDGAPTVDGLELKCRKCRYVLSRGLACDPLTNAQA